jgi:uncharacterized protein (DUF1800 family)
VAFLIAPAVVRADAFYTVPPCRVLDTREPDGPSGGPVLAAGAMRAIAVGGRCGISSAATAVSVNVTAVASTSDGYLTLFPAGTAMPATSTMNYRAGQVRANNAILRLGTAGAVSVFAGQGSGALNVLIDVNGYFDPSGNLQPVVSAGPDQAIPGATAALTGTASDDGQPAPLTYSWTKVSGPGAVSFGSPASLMSTATFGAIGVYVLRLTASDSQVPSFDDVVISAASSSADTVRLLEQSSFGPTNALIDHVQTIGPSAWIDEQLAAATSSYPTLPLQPSTIPPTCDTTCVRDNYTMYPLQRQFFTNALYGPDQLRQRVAFALHSLLVISGRDISQPSWVAPYLQIIDRNAFGNYRQLLYEMTLNPGMGRYLDMVTSTKNNPNENYAREILQLFSIGLDKLHLDGTPQLDGFGVPVPTYDQAGVTGFARVFTGWTFAAQPSPGIVNYLDPMRLIANNHETGTKELLDGLVLPAGQTGDQDLNAAIDDIFNHPNVGPFVGGHLIRSLVTSNPAPAYVARVAAKFNDNGSGVRGDLAAVVRAILLDPEARGDSKTDANYGHLREPVLFVNNILRAFNARSANGATASDGYLNPQTSAMEQDVFRPPTVFSYYPPDYLAPGTTDVRGPEFGIYSATTALRRANFVNTIVFSTIPVSANAPDGTSIDLTGLQALAGNPAALVEELNRVLLHGNISTAMRDSIVAAVSAVPGTNTLLRARQALYLVATSSQYQVQR